MNSTAKNNKTTKKSIDIPAAHQIMILGGGVGSATPHRWTFVVSVQERRLRQTQAQRAEFVESLTAAGTHSEADMHQLIEMEALMNADAEWLVVAAHHVIETGKKYQSLSNNDPEICRALAACEKAGPAALVRDICSHVEDYALGIGRLSPEGEHWGGPSLSYADPDNDATCDLKFTIMSTEFQRVYLYALSAAVRQLAERMHEIWEDTRERTNGWSDLDISTSTRPLTSTSVLTCRRLF